MIKQNKLDKEEFQMLSGTDLGVAMLHNKYMVTHPDVLDAIEKERFLVTPHAEVLEYVSRKGNDRDRWISGMQRLQESYEDWKPGED